MYYSDAGVYVSIFGYLPANIPEILAF